VFRRLTLEARRQGRAAALSQRGEDCEAAGPTTAFLSMAREGERACHGHGAGLGAEEPRHR
jgi:hypothetical protein